METVASPENTEECKFWKLTNPLCIKLYIEISNYVNQPHYSDDENGKIVFKILPQETVSLAMVRVQNWPKKLRVWFDKKQRPLASKLIPSFDALFLYPQWDIGDYIDNDRLEELIYADPTFNYNDRKLLFATFPNKNRVAKYNELKQLSLTLEKKK